MSDYNVASAVKRLEKTLSAAMYAMTSANLIAARIQSAKTELDRDKAIKEGDEVIETLRKLLFEKKEKQTPQETPPGTPWQEPLTSKWL